MLSKDPLSRCWAAGLCLLLWGCAPDDVAGETGDVVYEVSASSTTEVLTLRAVGSMRFVGTRYRLFGDGRLVREVVAKGQGRVVAAEEVSVPPEEVDLLMELIVAARLPEMTTASLAESLGRPPLRMDDGSTDVLTLQFDSYESPGVGLQAPFSPTVSLHAPHLQARFSPEAPEPQAFLALREALDGYFNRPAVEALEEAERLARIWSPKLVLAMTTQWNSSM